jgi:hypothetical protein
MGAPLGGLGGGIVCPVAALFYGRFCGALMAREAIMLAQDGGGLWGVELLEGSSEEGGAGGRKRKGLATLTRASP